MSISLVNKQTVVHPSHYGEQDGGGLVAKSCSTLSTPWTIARQVPLSMILQARILEWVGISFSRGSSRPRN